jgi:hypothetical protein
MFTQPFIAIRINSQHQADLRRQAARHETGRVAYDVRWAPQGVKVPRGVPRRWRWRYL